MPETEFLNFFVSFNALNTADTEDAGQPGDDDDMLVNIDLLVEPIDDHPTWFKMAEPFTLFGVTPLLDIGDIIQVEDTEYCDSLMTKVIERGRTWSHSAGVLTGGMDQLREEPLQPLLKRLIEAGGMWELCSLRVNLQYPLDPDQSEPPAHVLDLADRISSTLGDTTN